MHRTQSQFMCRARVFLTSISHMAVALVVLSAVHGVARANTVTLDGLRTNDYSTTITGTLGVDLGVFVDYLVVGGGGGGGNVFHAGGGGGGGVLSGSSQVTNSPNLFTIGAGGSASNNGGSSVAFGRTALGGGGGGNDNVAGKAGSSGGGGGWSAGSSGGGAGTAGQGFAGGAGIAPADPNGRAGGGGGGAGTSGSNAVSSFGGAGGSGIASSISGATVFYGGGGGGAAGSNGGLGGVGGGGRGASGGAILAGSGTNGLGGGGGGTNNTGSGGTGGTGTVIVSYPSSSLATAMTNGVTTSYNVSGTTWTVHTFSTSGSASLTLDTTNPARLSTINYGTIGGSGALEFLGPGTLNLAGPNTYSGGTRVRSGTLGIVSQVVSGSVFAGSIGSGSLQIDANAGFQVGVIGGGTTTLPASVTGAGRLSVEGFTTLALGNNMSSFTGDVVVQGGSIQLTSASGLGSTAGATSLLGTRNISQLDLNGQAVSGETLRIGNSQATNLDFLVVTNRNAGTGSWAGPIVLDCLSFKVENSAGDIVFSGPISGTGSIFKRGSGTFTISGSQSANRSFFAEGGMLRIDGVIGSGSAFVLCSPGSVSGTGTINGTAQFFDGTHAPGGTDAAGIQTIAGTLDYRRVTLDWSLFGNTTAGRGTNYDGVDVIGTLNASFPGEVNTVNVSFDALGSTVNWNDSFWASDRSWKMIDVTGTSNLGSSFLVPTASYVDAFGNGLLAVRPTSGFIVTNSGGDLTLNYLVAVPEPSTWAMAVVGMACAAWGACRRRWRRPNAIRAG